MAPDIPSDIRAMIIDLAERPTLVSLRLVSRAWSSLDETPLFRLISMHVGTKDDLKRHQNRMETLSTIGQSCNEIRLIFAGDFDTPTLCEDLDLITSRLGGKIRTLTLTNIRWQWNIPTHPVEHLALSRLFPNIRSLHIVNAFEYRTTWLCVVVSAWPGLLHLELKSSICARRKGPSENFCNKLLSFKLEEKYDHHWMFDWLMATPAMMTLQHIDLCITTCGALLSVIQLLARPDNPIRSVRLALQGGYWNPALDPELALKWSSLDNPHLTSLALRAETPNLTKTFYTVLDATQMPNLERIQLEFNLRHQRRISPPVVFNARKSVGVSHFPQLKEVLLRCEDWNPLSTEEDRADACRLLPILMQANEYGLLKVENLVS